MEIYVYAAYVRNLISFVIVGIFHALLFHRTQGKVSHNFLNLFMDTKLCINLFNINIVTLIEIIGTRYDHPPLILILCVFTASYRLYAAYNTCYSVNVWKTSSAFARFQKPSIATRQKVTKLWAVSR